MAYIASLHDGQHLRACSTPCCPQHGRRGSCASRSLGCFQPWLGAVDGSAIAAQLLRAFSPIAVWLGGDSKWDATSRPAYLFAPSSTAYQRLPFHIAGRLPLPSSVLERLFTLDARALAPALLRVMAVLRAACMRCEGCGGIVSASRLHELELFADRRCAASSTSLLRQQPQPVLR